MNALTKTSFAAALAVTTAFAAPAALAAAATASASFDGIVDIRTTDTATATLTGLDTLFAYGDFTGGIDDLLNDGMTFYSQSALLGEATATNDGPAGATALAATSDTSSALAGTRSDLGLLLGGTGMIEIDIAYSLAVDFFDILPTGGATAAVEAYVPFSTPATAFVSLVGMPGPGDLLEEFDVLTLSFFVDFATGLAPVPSALTISTYATAESAPVPVPAAVWLLGSAVAGIAGVARRQRAAAA
ncbi:MAG: VPLPA-CTERM sorting domain-containing protein [Gammaproteobacteria bacterium]